MALVVGVGGYRNVPTLANPPNDARDIAAALGRLGFETETLIDPDRLALEAGARRFGQRARGADAALFFFAGHALEASGRNWLLPAPADLRTDRDLRFEALDLEGVLEQLEGAARLSILILDACRDNPFRRRLQAASRNVTAASGLGQMNAAVGTLFAFATAPGTVADDGRGRNSPFTTALLRRIETPGLEIRQLMAEVRREVRETTQGRQIPWENSALEGSFYFRTAPPPPAPTPVAAPAAPALAAETVFWESVRASRNPADFRAYLARFPEGVFAALARNRLEELEGRRQPAETRRPDPSAMPNPATPEGREAMLQRVLALVQPVSASRLEVQVQSLRAYRDSQQHRAFAVAPGRQTSFRVTGASSAAAAEELTLERCQLRNGEPCVLFAVNETIRAPPSDGEWPRRDMERMRYEGNFRPDRIPALTAERRREADVAAYGRAREPKAMAIHPLGRIYSVTAARSPFAAQMEALRLCNDDPVRAGAAGPCFLYAVGTRVVVTGRHAEPLAADPAAPARPPEAQQATASVPAPAPAPTSAAAARPASAIPPPPDARAALHAEMVAAVPFLARSLAEAGLRDYLADRTNRAFAIAPEASSYWRIGGFGSPALAEERVLEACQLRYGVPCVLFAVNDEIRRPAEGGPWPRRDMPRLATATAGEFDVQRIPVLSARTRAHPLATGYATAPEPKAMAIHPWGRFFVASGASGPEVAEAAALAACNGDADRNGRDGPCLLYAVGNRLVIHERRTQAAAARPAAPPAAAQDRAALATDMAAVVPFLSRAAAQAGIAAYLTDRPHRAFAVAPERASSWRVAAMPSPAAAEQQALEGCQLRYGVQCVLFAVDDEIRRPAAGAEWLRHNMPRMRQADAAFEPERIPLLSESRRRLPQIANYGVAAEPKAMALHPWGRAFVATGAVSQQAAETAALAACNNDGDRAGVDGPCFLYASGNSVLIAERRTVARAAAPAASAVPASTTAPDPIRRIAAAAALIDPALRDRIPAFYTPAPREHHALALHLPSRRYFRWASAPSAEAAEQLALESCQQAYGSPCILLAAGMELRAPDPATAAPRDMLRVRYAGPYAAGQVPFQLPSLPREVERYAGMPEPKAMAIHVNGRVRVVGGAASQAAAEAQVLAACNEAGTPIPCVLYARGNRVVLGERLTEAPSP